MSVSFERLVLRSTFRDERQDNHANLSLLICGRLVYYNPRADALNSVHELSELDRLDHVRIHPKIVAFQQVNLFSRRSQHDDGDVLQRFINLRRRQHLMTVYFQWLFAWEDDAKLRWFAIRAFTLVTKKI